MCWYLTLTQHLFMSIWPYNYFLLTYTLPAICTNLVYMHIREYMSLISSTVHIKLIEISDERVVSSWWRSVQWIQVYPLILYSPKLSQIIEICATFTGITSKEKYAVFEWKTMGSWSWGWSFQILNWLAWENSLPCVCFWAIMISNVISVGLTRF